MAVFIIKQGDLTEDELKQAIVRAISDKKDTWLNDAGVSIIMQIA